MRTLLVDIRFREEVDIDKFWMWLAGSEETRGYCQSIVCLKTKQGWLE